MAVGNAPECDTSHEYHLGHALVEFLMMHWRYQPLRDFVVCIQAVLTALQAAIHGSPAVGGMNEGSSYEAFVNSQISETTRVGIVERLDNVFVKENRDLGLYA